MKSGKIAVFGLILAAAMGSAPAKAVQPAPAAGVAAATVSAVNETEAKVSVAQVAKAGKKARSPRRKSRIAGGVPAAPKTAAPVSVS